MSMEYSYRVKPRDDGPGLIETNTNVVFKSIGLYAADCYQVDYWIELGNCHNYYMTPIDNPFRLINIWPRCCEWELIVSIGFIYNEFVKHPDGFLLNRFGCSPVPLKGNYMGRMMKMKMLGRDE